MASDKSIGAKNNNPEVFLGKGVLETCSKFTVEHPPIPMLCNFIEIGLYGNIVYKMQIEMSDFRTLIFRIF